MCTIALAHNDLVTTHVHHAESAKERERFYFWRLGIGHYSEILIFLSRWCKDPAIEAFIASSPAELQEAYAQTIDLYSNCRSTAKHLRNEAIFHYPNPKGIKAMRQALRNPELQKAKGGVTSESGKVRDSRMHYADEVIATMVWNARGGTEEKFEESAAALGEAVSAFMKFANGAQDHFLLTRLDGVVTRHVGAPSA